jgi:transposase
MGRKITVITESLVEQAKCDLKSIGSKGVVANRLQAIISGQKHGIKKVCEVLDINRSTVNEWMNNYKAKGMDGLANACKPSRAKLGGDHGATLGQWVKEKPNSTLKELVLRCASELGVTVGKSSIHRALVKLGFAHITGRKKHYKSNVEAQEEFKKN